MKKKITLLTVLMLACFSFGVFYASLYIKNTTDEFNRLLDLRKIEDLRKNLVISTQTARSDLYTVRTPLSKTLDSIENHVSKLHESATNCLSCHHNAEVTKRLEEIRTLIMEYQEALSYYITASADLERIERLKLEASVIGDKLLFTAEEMSAEANHKLGVYTASAFEKVNKAQAILLITTVVTLLAGVIFGFKIVRSTIRPVSELVKATRVIAAGDLGYTMDLKEPTEFGEIARNFNSMSVALKDSYAKLQAETAERKKIEEELIKAQRLESLGILAGGIAHDFNNLLTAILGNIELLRDSVKGEPETSEFLTDATNASLRARDLTQQLLTFSRGGDPLKMTISVEDVARESASFALRGSRVSGHFAFADGLWSIEGDRGQISQVIHNLVLNARDAMPDGGTVAIAAENATLDEGNRLSLASGRYIRISVKDTGIGIADENLAKIFDPYFTTKILGSQRGMGLGLAICYSIVRKHDGHIMVDSVAGAGSVFTVYLRAAEDTARGPAAAEQSRATGKGRVLFMDDEEVVRRAAGMMLQRLGYTVEFAVDGEEAIDLYTKSHKASRPFDLVILDLTVPGRMGGRETVQQLVRIDPRIRAVVSSGYSNNPEMADFRKYGFRGYIPKPYQMSELEQVLNGVLNEVGSSLQGG